MTKLHGVRSLGSIVIYKKVKCMVVNAVLHINLSGEKEYAYDLECLENDIKWDGVYNRSFQVLIRRTPEEEAIDRYECVMESIKKVELEVNQKIKRAERYDTWGDDDFIFNRHEQEMIHARIKKASGLYKLYETRDELIQDMLVSTISTKEVELV